MLINSPLRGIRTLPTEADTVPGQIGLRELSRSLSAVPSLWNPCLRLCALLLGMLFLEVSAAAQAIPGKPDPLQKSPIALPQQIHLPVYLHLYLWEGVGTVIGHINNKDTLERFVLDTGLNACTVSPPIYTRYSLLALPSNVHIDVFDQATTAREVRIDSLQFELLHLGSFSAALINTFDIISRSARKDVPLCWLGAPFLSAFLPTFDFANQTVTLENAKTKPTLEPGAVVLPMTLRDGRPYIKVTVPGVKTFTAMIDTGAPATLLPGFIAAKLKLKPTLLIPLQGKSGKETMTGVATIPKLDVGKLEIKDVRAVFIASNAPAEFDQSMAILGVDFLSRFKVTVDYLQKRVIFTPPPAPEPTPTTAAKAP